MSGTPPEYVKQGSFDVVPETWARAKEEIRRILIEKAASRTMIPYSELVGLVEAVAFAPHDTKLFAMLGQISLAEHEQGRPLLSVLVVHKAGDMRPGEGFFELCGALGRDTSDVDKTWIEETRNVFAYWTKRVPPNP